MRYEATVSESGRITIPATVREQLDLDAGDTVHFRFDEDQGVRIQPVLSDPRNRLERARERGSSLELDAAELLDEERNEWA